MINHQYVSHVVCCAYCSQIDWHRRKLIDFSAGHTKLDASITADYGVKAWFGAEFEGSVQLAIADILRYENTYSFWIGVVYDISESYRSRIF